MHVHTLDARIHHEFLSENRKDPVTLEPLRPGDSIVICASPHHFAFQAVNWRGECPFCHNSETLSFVPTTRTELRFSRSHEHRARTTLFVVLVIASLLGCGVVVAAFYASTPKSVSIQETRQIPTVTTVLTPTPKRPTISTAIPTPKPTPIPTALILTETDSVRQVIEQFYKVRDYSNRYLDDSTLESILVGKALEQQKNIIAKLREKNCYWIFKDRQLVFTNWQARGANGMSVDVSVIENADLYCNMKRDPGSYTSNDPYINHFVVDKYQNSWYISNRWRK